MPDLKLIITERGGFFDTKDKKKLIRSNLKKAMYKSVGLLWRDVILGTPEGVGGAKGGLKSTIFQKVTFGTKTILGKVGHQSLHGDVIELGRRPGQKMPPKGSLLTWLEVVAGLDPEEALDVEWGVRRNIGKFGTKGVFMFEKAFLKDFKKVTKFFNDAGFNIARKLS